MSRHRASAGTTAPILFVHNGQDWITGSERCLLDLMSRVDPDRFTPVLLCNAGANAIAAAARDLRIPVYRSVGWSSAGSRLLPPHRYVREVRDLVERHGIRLIHANDLDPVPSLVPVARARRIPLLAHLHIPARRTERRFAWVHQVSYAVGVGRAVLDDLLQDGFPPDRGEVVYNAVDPARLDAGDARSLRQTLAIPVGARTITVVGSLIHRKGTDVVLEAVRRLADGDTDAHLLVLGDGPEESALRERATQLGIASRVHFLGRRSDVGAILRDATDVFVSASRAEAFPLTLLEAAYCRAPAVASDIAPHRESVLAGVTGDLVPVENADALADAVAALLKDHDRRARYGGAGHARIVDHFLVERYVADFERIFERLLTADPSRYGWIRGSSWPHDYTSWLVEAVGRRLGVRRSDSVATA